MNLSIAILSVGDFQEFPVRNRNNLEASVSFSFCLSFLTNRPRISLTTSIVTVENQYGNNLALATATTSGSRPAGWPVTLHSILNPPITTTASVALLLLPPLSPSPSLLLARREMAGLCKRRGRKKG